MEKKVKKFTSFKEAEEAEMEYWQNASHEERVRVFLTLQENRLKLFYPDFKGMEKVVSKRNKHEDDE
jgi:hypothetical protein